MGRIMKMVISLYKARDAVERDEWTFSPKIQKKLQVKWAWEDCEKCGSKIFYVREVIAKDPRTSKYCDYDDTVEIGLVCAECGHFETEHDTESWYQTAVHNILCPPEKPTPKPKKKKLPGWDNPPKISQVLVEGKSKKKKRKKGKKKNAKK